MKKYLYEGKNKDQVLNLAFYELNVNEENMIYNIKEESNGFLKGKKVVVECIKFQDIADYAKGILNEILKGMNIDSKIEMSLKNQIISLNIHSDKNSLIIGKKGHILDALQTFIKFAIYNEVEKYINIIIDVEGYKEKQVYFLQRDTKKVARDVLKTKEQIKLDPMKAYERKIVHDVLNNYKNIETISEGVEPNRCVIVKYKED